MDNAHQVLQDKINEERYKARIDIALNQLKSSIDALKEENLSLKSAVESQNLIIKAQQEKLIDAVDKKIKSNSCEVERSVKESKAFQKDIKRSLADQETLFITVNEFNLQMDALQKSNSGLCSDIKVLKSSLIEMIKSLSLDIEDKLSQLKASIPIMESKESIKAREEKLDVLVMDVTNAAARAINCEKQLGLVDKKIDLINVSLKAIQLKD